MYVEYAERNVSMKNACKVLDNKTSSELKLVAILSLPKLEDKQVQRARQLISLVDFSRVKALVEHYRVGPCVCCNVNNYFIADFPADLVCWLGEKYKKNTDASKKQFLIYSQLLRLSETVDIPVVFFKGIPLAKKLYGDIAKRHSSDIDIIISQTNFDQFHDLLLDMGFSNELFCSIPNALRSLYFSRHKDVTYKDKNGNIIELHLRLQAHSASLGRELSKRLLSEELTDEELFVYLCWHSASTLHHRLKWLTDLVVLIKQGGLSWQYVHQIASDLDVDRCVMLNLLLIELVYEVEIPDNAYEYFKFDDSIYKLCSGSLNNLNNLVTSDSLFQIKIMFRELCLTKSLASKFLIIWQAFKPSIMDIHFLPDIPVRFRGLYYIARPISVFLRTVKGKQT